jgi:tripartite-type tricarboxylate transporter receptor subunit TctC
MKRLVAVFFGVIALTASSTPFAQSYPNKPIRMVVPFAAGGGTDAIARTVAPPLSEQLGQSIVIDNRAGANGAIGTAEVKRAPADGYTILVGVAGTMVVAPHLNAELPFNAQKDFVPITLAATSPFIIAVHPSLPVNSIGELVSYAKANPNKLNFGSSGSGGAPHLAGELFKRTAGVQMIHVPYRGLALAITDLLAGQIQVGFIDVGLAMPHVKSGKLKALAITSAQRSATAPELPTVAESGVPGYSSGTWYGFFAPAGTSDSIVQRLDTEVVKVLNSPDVKSKLIAQGAEPATLSRDRFKTFVADESAKWAKLIREAAIKLE